MQQCSACHRFLGARDRGCRFCGSPHLEPLRIGAETDEELRNYRVLVDEIVLEGRGRRFRVRDIVGQGSHGVVLKVTPPGGEDYAMKLPLEFNESFSNSQGNRKSTLETSRKYISHELKMLNKIRNEALIDVLYAGPVYCRRKETESRFPAILMELAAATLKDIIDGEMAGLLEVPYEEKLNMIGQLTAGIEKLHRGRVVHRDLSPHNVFVVDREGEIRYVLADFGTSKPAMAYEERNSTTRMAFHDRYMDPALFLYDRFRYDSRIDIYQLGVIITEILLGEYWQTGDDETCAADFGRTDFENEFLLKFARNEISPAILGKIRRATTLDLKNRYRTASQFKKEMHEVLAREQEKGDRPKPRDRVKRNINISFKRIFPPEEGGGGGEIPTILYRGQKKIDLQTADAVKIDFADFRLKRAKIAAPSFLECQKRENTVFLAVDTEDIQKKIGPIAPAGHRRSPGSPFKSRPGAETKTKKPFRIEFDCQSVLHIEGAREDDR